MITFKYQNGWEKTLADINLEHKIVPKLGQYLSKNNKPLKPLSTIQHMLSSDPSINKNLPEFVSVMIQYIFNTYDADKTLFGLFQLLNPKRISPFLATHDYCVRIISCDKHGVARLNISPIYHLGPEYPEYYKEKEGRALSKEAIIGLVESKNNNSIDGVHTRFNLGIDAGIAFKDANISHNKEMLLEFNIVDEGVIANLHCESQTTSKVFTWENLGMSQTSCSDTYSEKVQEGWEEIWAA